MNRSFVDRYFPSQNPLGRHITLSAPFRAPGTEIVGIVKDSKYNDLREQAVPMAFFSLWQKPTTDVQIILRTGATAGVEADARRTIHEISPRLPVLGVTTLNAQIEESLDQQKLLTALCSIFGLLALTLASVGMYGTLAYSIAGRTVEIGIRMAIGAQRYHVVAMILRDSFGIIALGLVAGLPLALGATRWLRSFLFGVSEMDPLAITAAIVVIVAVAFPAAFLPARRAAGIDPMRAVRHE